MNKKNNIIAFQGVKGAHSDMACRISHPYMDTVSYHSFGKLWIQYQVIKQDYIDSIENSKQDVLLRFIIC